MQNVQVSSFMEHKTPLSTVLLKFYLFVVLKQIICQNVLHMETYCSSPIYHCCNLFSEETFWLMILRLLSACRLYVEIDVRLFEIDATM